MKSTTFWQAPAFEEIVAMTKRPGSVMFYCCLVIEFSILIMTPRMVEFTRQILKVAHPSFYRQLLRLHCYFAELSIAPGGLISIEMVITLTTTLLKISFSCVLNSTGIELGPIALNRRVFLSRTFIWSDFFSFPTLQNCY